MDFINDIDFILPFGGGKIDLLAQGAHVIHTGVGGGIDLDQVQEAAGVDLAAILAFVAGALGEVGLQAVDRLGQQAGGGGLAGAARAGEQIRVGYAILADGALEGDDHMILAMHLVPVLRPPFTIIRLCHTTPCVFGLQYELILIQLRQERRMAVIFKVHCR